MAQRFLLLIAACLTITLAVPPSPATAGHKKEQAFAVSLARKGLWNEAAFRFRGLVEKNPYNARLWNNLAVCYEAARQYDKASEAYQRAMELDDGDLAPIQMNREAFELFYKSWSAHSGPPEDNEEALPEKAPGEGNRSG